MDILRNQHYDELTYVVYDAPFCWMHFGGQKKYQVESSLQRIREYLPSGVFFQCNRSTIINLYRCIRSNKAKTEIEMDDQTKHRLSRRRKKDFFKAMYERPMKPENEIEAT